MLFSGSLARSEEALRASESQKAAEEEAKRQQASANTVGSKFFSLTGTPVGKATLQYNSFFLKCSRNGS